MARRSLETFRMTTILAIETSCDETAAAIISGGRKIRANIVASQIDLHAQYGGVFPELASRAHAEGISAVVSRALAEADLDYAQLDAIAVTQGPGLVGSLLVGLGFAKGLALATGLPLLGINHLEGHVYSQWLADDFSEPAFPILAMIVSGGHSELLLMRTHGRYQRLGGTIDDAAGEAFDKVGRLLSLPFPGGPAIEKAAQAGDKNAYAFPRAKTESAYDLSFSGLKTAVVRAVTVQPDDRNHRPRRAERQAQLRDDAHIPDVAAAFQDAVTDALVAAALAASRDYAASALFVSGGVSANKLLRDKLRQRLELPVYSPPLFLCSDNAAMIGAAAHLRYLAGHRSSLDIEARARWLLSEDVYAAG
ncbi:MAG: tRNA (adenosine(37)-N6)-threonylcarbamoyltransferase complex transferase subunit TsaD [Chloroflexi bacterium]|nr:tRNA (adenosine(37)-N6)-threonylcarbamoyltransferase complex transferase subunit TsaD [Chloroflexota bacterium]MYC53951.1 tRNA (adenosine(37)-N6)-threonylcarbamoyltransferase complex transferase subunit TsaD [Chloroflexota bacterium]MYE77524.1 tRNA (adenosine(37)-N6)-threonylcarbamoyltransferase complex transferase subunit TsaD [Chloroflexota bacterium]